MGIRAEKNGGVQSTAAASVPVRPAQAMRPKTGIPGGKACCRNSMQDNLLYAICMPDAVLTTAVIDFPVRLIKSNRPDVQHCLEMVQKLLSLYQSGTSCC
jgi:hypothetical protein